MAKTKLVINYEFDFDLFGLISTEKEYKIAWLINRQLNIHLVKDQDIKLEFLKSEEISISNYLYQTENAALRLLKNKSENKNDGRMAYLLPELSKFDFLLMKKGYLDGMFDKHFLEEIKHIKEIQYITKVKIDNLKSKENLIF